MDFGRLLHTAQKNEKTKDQRVQYYSTKFEPPKKEKKSSQLSDNIKKFLAKKEAEEKKVAEEAKKRRDELLALRSQDKKATKRVNVMLKRTKSANQSVIEDAVDNDNTAVTLAGPMQPDEDDYGYVSQEASQFYNQMMEKYSKMPDEPKFDMTKKKVSTNLGTTKDRVKAALEREKEEAMMPHKRKRKHKDKKEDEDEEGVSYDAPDRTTEETKSCEKSDKEKMPPPKPKPKMAPPPMNFAELLKIAEKKQFEPIVIEKQEKEDERLLTKKQRRDMERERESQQRREERRRHQLSNVRIPKAGEKEKPTSTSLSTSTSNPSAKSPEKSYEKQKPVKANGSNSSDIPKPTSSGISKVDTEKPVRKRGAGSKAKPTNTISAKKRREMEELFPEETRPGRKYLPGDARYKPEQETKQFPPSDLQPKKQLPETNCKAPLKTPSSDSFSKRPLSSNSQHPQLKKAPPSDSRLSREAQSADFRSSREPSSKGGVSQTDVRSSREPSSKVPQKKPSMEAQPKRFPPEDVRRKLPPKLPPKQFPPPDVRRSEVGSSKVVAKKGRILDDDDEDEYDSEMDDFIDDDDAGEDISRYISEIFGYDKKRYREIDDDIDDMETTFAQQMKEEVVSTKIGIMEDLEEERKEEEARRRKLQMKKKMKVS